MIPAEWVVAAAERLSNRIEITPLTYDPKLNIFLKWENHQQTGSFKLRGALNKVLALEPWEQERGLVAVSAGNHGLGVAYAAKQVHSKATVFITESAVENKVKALQQNGVEVIKIHGDFAAAEKAAQAYAIHKGATWVSPYNDAQVIAGQATIGLEIVQQMPSFDASVFLVPLGAGSLIAGVGIGLKQLGKSVRLIGIQAEASSYFYSLFHYGTKKGVIETDSLADGLKGGVEANSITIPLVRSMIDDCILVKEEDIAYAIAYAWYHYHEIIEGSAAVTLAAILTGAIKEKPSLLVISGGNIEPELHRKICETWKPEMDLTG